MSNKKWIWNKLIPWILFLGGFLVVIIHGQHQRHLLKKFPRYTIGTTTKTYWTVSAGKWVEYFYIVNNVCLNNDERYNDSQVPGGKYYVKFYVKDPKNSELLQDKPVPDSIKEAPPKDGRKFRGGNNIMLISSRQNPNFVYKKIILCLNLSSPLISPTCPPSPAGRRSITV